MFIFLPTKNTKTKRCLLREDFSGNVTVFNSELNSLQNVYVAILTFGKPTKWHCFVTYLSNNPHTNFPAEFSGTGLGVGRCPGLEINSEWMQFITVPSHFKHWVYLKSGWCSKMQYEPEGSLSCPSNDIADQPASMSSWLRCG